MSIGFRHSHSDVRRQPFTDLARETHLVSELSIPSRGVDHRYRGERQRESAGVAERSQADGKYLYVANGDSTVSVITLV
jgi:hypothetical protein